MAEGMACTLYPPLKQDKLYVWKYCGFQTETNGGMRSLPFIYSLFVQDDRPSD